MEVWTILRMLHFRRGGRLVNVTLYTKESEVVNVGGGEYRKWCMLGVNVWVVNVGQSYIVFTFEGQKRSLSGR